MLSVDQGTTSKHPSQQQAPTPVHSPPQSGQPPALLVPRLPHEIHSLDDLSASDLVVSGNFGRHVAGAVSTTRRPSIFRRCYSSESNVPTWYLPGGSTDSAALADCLPPYYWQAKHIQKLIKVSDDEFYIFLRSVSKADPVSSRKHLAAGAQLTTKTIVVTLYLLLLFLCLSALFMCRLMARRDTNTVKTNTKVDTPDPFCVRIFALI